MRNVTLSTSTLWPRYPPFSSWPIMKFPTLILGEWRGGGGLIMRYDRDWIPKFATKDYVFLTFSLFLKK